MTTTVDVTAHPYKSNDGRNLVVSVKCFNTYPKCFKTHQTKEDELAFPEIRLQNGQKWQGSTYEGRKIVIEEVIE